MVAPIPVDGSDSHEAQKRRRLRRKQASHDGRLVFGANYDHLDCVIRDFSDGGARVWVSDADAVPENVTLLEPNNLMAYDATATWRCGNLIGLSFDRAFSLDTEEAVRLVALRQMIVEIKEQLPADMPPKANGASSD